MSRRNYHRNVARLLRVGSVGAEFRWRRCNRLAYTKTQVVVKNESLIVKSRLPHYLWCLALLQQLSGVILMARDLS